MITESCGNVFADLGIPTPQIVALKRGALVGIPARIISYGDEVTTLGEPDQLIVISYETPQTLDGYRVSRLLVCLSEVIPCGPMELAA